MAYTPAFQSSIVNVDKNTTLETPLYSNARYAPVEVILNSRIKNVLGRDIVKTPESISGRDY